MIHKRLRKIYCVGVVKNFGESPRGVVIRAIGTYHTQPGGADKPIPVEPGDYCVWSRKPTQAALPNICSECGRALAA